MDNNELMSKERLDEIRAHWPHWVKDPLTTELFDALDFATSIVAELKAERDYYSKQYTRNRDYIEYLEKEQKRIQRIISYAGT